MLREEAAIKMSVVTTPPISYCMSRFSTELDAPTFDVALRKWRVTTNAFILKKKKILNQRWAKCDLPTYATRHARANRRNTKQQGWNSTNNSFTRICKKLLFINTPCFWKYSRAPFIRIGLVLLGKFVENSTKLTCLEISGYRIKYSTVLWLLELHIRGGRKVQMHVHTVNSTRRTSNCQCSLFSKKKSNKPEFLLIRMARRPLIRISGVIM